MKTLIVVGILITLSDDGSVSTTTVPIPSLEECQRRIGMMAQEDYTRSFCLFVERENKTND